MDRDWTRSTLPKSLPSPPHPAFGTGHRGNGKVARLPKAIRDQLDNMILDGVSYPHNRTKGSHFTPVQFIADCQARSGSEEVYGDGAPQNRSATARMILSDDPRIWRPLR